MKQGLICALALCLLLFAAPASAQSVIFTYAGNGYAAFSGDGGPALYTSFNQPTGMAYDSHGNIYVAEQSNHRVRMITPAGIVSTFAGTGSAGFSGDGGPGIAARLNNPTWVAVDASNNVYICDAANNRVRVVNAITGVMTTYAGGGGSLGDGGQATNATLNQPWQIALDSSGNLYIGDAANYRIRKVTASSGIITTIAGNGTAGFSGDNGPATLAQLQWGFAVNVDSAGNVYIGDNQNARVRRVDAGTGNITTFAGSGCSNCAGSYGGDGGPATTARLSYPQGISFDASGNVYIADSGNARIRMVNPGTGIISTVVGNGTHGYAGDGGSPTAAQIDNPQVAFFDPSGNMLVPDFANNHIRKIIPTPTNNPQATVSTMQPAAAVVNSGAFSIYVNGSNFVPGAVVQWNGSSLTTGFLGSNHLVASVPATFIGSAGTQPVTVANPGAAASLPLTFTIYNSTPSTNGVITTIAGSGYGGFSGDGGTALYTSIDQPVGVVFDSAGNMYVSESSNCRIRKIAPNGTVSTFAGTGGCSYSGDGGPALLAQINDPAGMVFDGSGNLYFADYANHAVRRIASNGTITTVAGTGVPGYNGDNIQATSAKLNYPWSVALDSSGNLYISDYSNNRIRKVTVSTGIITTVAGNGIGGYFGDGGPATTSPLNGPLGIAFDSGGNLLLVDEYNHRIRRISAADGTISTVAGNGSNGFSGDGGAAIYARLSYPETIQFDSAGNLYIGDTNNNRVRRMDQNGVITTFAASGCACFGGDGGPAVAASIASPLYMAFDASGNFYVADYGNRRVRKVQAPTGSNPVASINSIVPSAIQAGNGGFTMVVNGSNFAPGAVVQWNSGTRITTYVSSTQLTASIVSTDLQSVGTATVNVLNPNSTGPSPNLTFTIYAAPAPSTSLVVTKYGSGYGGYSGDGGPGLYTSIDDPQGVVFDSSGNLYVADYNNQLIRKITPAGIVTSIAGTGSAGYSGDGGPGSAAQINRPVGLAIDNSGNIYIAEQSNHRIRKVALDGTIRTVAGNGNAAFAGDGGLATAASLSSPDDVRVDAAGNLYIADTGNNRIRKVNTSGVISTIAGNGIYGYWGDGGPATTSPLNVPCCLALDAAGNVYFSDQSNHRIRKIALDGTISTVAGNGSGTYGGDGGPAIYASLRYPAGLLLDASGNLYIADQSNQRIRMVNSGGIISTIAGNGSNSFSGDGGLATSAGVSYPAFLAFGAGNTIYFSDPGNDRIRVIEAPPSSNPVPAITVLTPAAAQVSGGGFTILVYGTNFAPGAVVEWNGATRLTSYISSTLLSASITSFDIQAVGTAQVTVVNPPTGGGSSTAATFTIYAAPAAPTAVITTQYGNGYAGFSGDNGPGLYTALNNPHFVLYDPAGNLYVSEWDGQRVRKITPAGVATTLAGNGVYGFGGDNGPASSAQLRNPYGLALDGAGNLYIADRSNNRIRMVTPGGTIITVAGNGSCSFSGDGGQATSASLCNPSSVAVDTTGNLYIADQYNHRIRKVAVTTTGIITTVAGNGINGYYGDGGQATTSPLSYPEHVTLDANGILYIADSGNNRVRKVLANGTIVAVAGTGCSCYGGDGGPAIYAAIYNPLGLTFDSGGNLYIADYYNQRIRRVDTNGIITTVAGNGSRNFSGDGGLATGATLQYPIGIAIDPSGHLVFADAGNERIRVVQAPPTNSPVPSITGLAPASAQAGSSPFSIAVYGTDPAHPFVPGAVVQYNSSPRITTYVNTTLLYANLTSNDLQSPGSGQVVVVNPTTGGGGGPSSAVTFNIFPAPAASTLLIQKFAGNGTGGFSGDNGPATAAQVNAPGKMVFDASGNMYFADYSNNRVRKITPGGTISTFAGGGSSFGDGGPATGAQLANPVAVAFDGGGNLYVSEWSGHRVRKVAPNGIITTFAGTGSAGFSGDGGQASGATLYNPDGLATDAQGRVYIADYNNQRIRMVALNGTISTIAGNGLNAYFGDGGPAVDSPLNNPTDVAVDSAGDVFVADNGNNRIRMISAANGTIMTVAGTGCYCYGGDTGAAIYAGLAAPNGIVLDASGNLFIADAGNNRIREVSSGGIIYTVAGTGSYNYSGDGGLAINATFRSANWVGLDASGNLYISDPNNAYIRVVNGATGSLCFYSLSATNPSYGPGAATGTVNVTTGATCTWTVTSNQTSWLNVQSVTSSAGTTANNGTGNGTVSYTLAQNTSTLSRSGNLTIAGQIVTVTQSGTGCSYNLSATSVNEPAGNVTDSVTLNTGSGCVWTATSNNPDWITVTSASSGTGTGSAITISFALAANPTSAPRTGTVTIGGQQFTIIQAGAACTYSLQGNSVSYDAASHTGSVGVVATTGCNWSAVSNAPFITLSGSTTGQGNGTVNYLITANTLTAPRSGTITVSGVSGINFTINQAGFVSPVGTISANGAHGSPGSTASIPITLVLQSGSLDSTSFGLSITPVGAAPALTGTLSFTADAAMPAPSLLDTGNGPNSIAVFWQGLSPSLNAGTISLGAVVVNIPASAVIGQTYSVQITGASGSFASAPVTLSAGAATSVLLGSTYLVGDAFPVPSSAGDLDGDGLYDDAGEFGDGALNNLDLIWMLRAVVNLPAPPGSPAYLPAPCSDRYDAMDTSPVDTTSARGGDGAINNLDLIITLRRVVAIDSTRPQRGTRGMACTASLQAELTRQNAERLARAELVGSLVFGAPEAGNDGGQRVPVYLVSNRDLFLTGLSFGAGIAGSKSQFHFDSAQEQPATMVDQGVAGAVAASWLDGLHANAGQHLLLGYISGDGVDAGSLAAFGISANAREDGRVLRVTFAVTQ